MRAVALPASAVMALAASLSACGGGSSSSLTLYSGQHPQLTGALVAAFERRTGISVKVSNKDGVVLADQILQEGSASPADVYLTENSPELMRLQQHGLLARLGSPTLSAVPDAASSPQGAWVGVAVRVSALAYDPSMVAVGQLPASVLDLAQPQWSGKVGIAPTDSDFLPLVGAVAASRGDSQALAWLRGLRRNAVVYQDDEALAAAVNRGAVAAGVMNQYYWYRLRLEVGAGGMHSQLASFAPGDVGNLVNVSGAAVLASSANQTAARRFVAFLVSEEGQRIIATSDDFEYPLRPGVGANPALVPLSSLPTTSVNVVALGTDQEASKLVQQAGLA
jgi:iron(III) transport system substrate-binding protein